MLSSALSACGRGWGQQRIIDAINAEGVPCLVGSCSEIYLERAFPKEMRPPKRLPVARGLGETSLMFPVHPTLNESDMHDIADAVEKVLLMASKCSPIIRCAKCSK